MAIVYRTGDLLSSSCKVILHGTNAQGVMGSGIAKQIRKKWPNVYEIYHLRYKTFGLNLGDIIPVFTVDGRVVVNCVTQENFGHDKKCYVDYDAIEQCISKIDNLVYNWDTTEVGMPMIGAGLGGGEWPLIEDIIIRNAKKFIPVVYVL